jgi:flagellar assembly protein FliH
MPVTFTINITKPIRQVKILDDYDVSSSGCNPASIDAVNSINEGRETAEGKIKDLSAEHIAEMERKKAEVEQLCRSLNRLVEELNRFYGEVINNHKGEIAKLSVEIANKVLMQKIQKGDYQIESIITEVLKTAPTCQDVVVHLNPEDLILYQKLQKDGVADTLKGIKIISDPNIGLAECLLETPKGIVKSLVEEHIEQISKALSKVE